MSIIFPPKYANFEEKETNFLENRKIETFGEFTKGFVVEPRNIQGLIDSIAKIEENGKSYYSEACRKRAEEHFDKDKCFDKYIELYDSLINKE